METAEHDAGRYDLALVDDAGRIMRYIDVGVTLDDARAGRKLFAGLCQTAVVLTTKQPKRIKLAGIIEETQEHGT